MGSKTPGGMVVLLLFRCLLSFTVIMTYPLIGRSTGDTNNSSYAMPSSNNPNGFNSLPSAVTTRLSSFASNPMAAQATPAVSPMSIPQTYPPTPLINSQFPSSIVSQPSAMINPQQFPSTNVPQPQPTAGFGQSGPSPGATGVNPVASTTLPTALMSFMTNPTFLTTLIAITPSLAPTTHPTNILPPAVVQHIQLTFTYKYSRLFANEFDELAFLHVVRPDLSTMCGISADRLDDVIISSNSSEFVVLRFKILQGYPVFQSEAVQNLRSRLTFPNVQLGNKLLTVDESIFWTDDGICPTEPCQNSGLCNVTTDGEYTCSCGVDFTGPLCETAVPPARRINYNLLYLLILLLIPIAAAVAVGFVFGMRRKQKQHLEKVFDLRDVRTIGPKSMLSLPLEPGMRNEMYDTRSYTLAFNDTTFSPLTNEKSSTSDDDIKSTY